MRDYFPYIRKAVFKFDNQDDIVDDVIRQVTATEAERQDVKNAVASYFSAVSESPKTMWPTDTVKIDQEDYAIEKQAQVESPVVDTQVDSIQPDPQISALADEFAQIHNLGKVRPGGIQINNKDVENFLRMKKMVMYMRPLLDELNKRYKMQLETGTEKITKHKVTTALSELESDLAASGESEAAKIVKDINNGAVA